MNMKQITALFALLFCVSLAFGQTIEKSQSIMIYDIKPTVAPCTFCSERAFVRADNTEYWWDGDSWEKWYDGNSYLTALVQDSIIVTTRFGVEVDRDTVRVAGAAAGALLAANNLSDVANAVTARTNIGADVAGNVNIVDAGGLYVATQVEAALQEGAVERLVLDGLIGDLVTLSGVPVTSTNLGTFTGSTIADNETIKGALQDLETAVEAGGSGVDSFTISDQTIYRNTASAVTGNAVLDVLSGALLPVQNNSKLTDTIQPPSGFSAPVPFWISRNEDGTYATQYDDIEVWRDSFLSNVPSNGIYYLDGIAGNDSNDGRTKATAKKTLTAVRSLTPSPRRVYIKGTMYNTSTLNMGADTLQLIAYGGTPEIFRLITFPTWSAVGAGVYSTTQIAVGADRILLSTKRDDDGVLIPLKQATSLAEMTNATDTYYSDGTTFYVILDGSTPVQFGNIVIAASNHSTFTQTRLYAEGIRMYGGVIYGVATGKVAFRDCSNYHLNSGSVVDLMDFTNGTTYLYNHQVGYAGADAIDWKGATTVGYEINCSGKWAGLSASGSNDQISTGHLGSRVVTINANYQLARSQALADINAGTQRWILGGNFGNCWEFTSAAIGALLDAEVWVDNAKVGGRQFDYTVWDGATLHLRNININQNSRVDVQVGGTINEY